MEEKNKMIYGIHSVLEFLKEGKPIDQILIKKQSDNEGIREIIYLARKLNVTVKSVPVEKLQRITQKNHQGVIAFASPIEFHELEQVIPQIYEQGNTPLIVVLDQITDVRNFGAIVRSCDCFGVHAIVIPQKGAAQVSSDAIKTSAGALQKIPICKVKSLYSACKYLKDCGLQIVSASEKFSDMVYTVSMQEPTVLVMGSEEIGVSKEIEEMSDFRISIPMLGTISSLNVSVATGICLYEISRQRKS